jgi:hypothetical protein
MRTALQSVPLLLIGFALIGCSKDSGSSGAQQGTIDSSLPVVSVTIPDLT